MSENIQVSISNDSVQSIIKAHVHGAVLNALKPHSEQLVREMVEKSLLFKNQNSDRNRYKKDHEQVTVLEEIVQTMIAEEATKAIKSWAESHREQIGEQIRLAIGKQGFAKKWAMQMVDGMLNATIYNFKVDVIPGFKDKER